MAVHQLCTVTMTSASAWRYPQRRGLRRENKKAPRGAACGHLDSPASGRFFETRTQADAVWSRGTADRDHRSYLAACDGQGLESARAPSSGRPPSSRRRYAPLCLTTLALGRQRRWRCCLGNKAARCRWAGIAHELTSARTSETALAAHPALLACEGDRPSSSVR